MSCPHYCQCAELQYFLCSVNKYKSLTAIQLQVTIILLNAGVAELADAADLKSAGVILVGSSPAPGTTVTFPLPLTLLLAQYL